MKKNVLTRKQFEEQIKNGKGPSISMRYRSSDYQMYRFLMSQDNQTELIRTMISMVNKMYPPNSSGDNPGVRAQIESFIDSEEFTGNYDENRLRKIIEETVETVLKQIGNNGSCSLESVEEIQQNKTYEMDQVQEPESNEKEVGFVFEEQPIEIEDSY